MNNDGAVFDIITSHGDGAPLASPPDNTVSAMHLGYIRSFLGNKAHLFTQDTLDALFNVRPPVEGERAEDVDRNTLAYVANLLHKVQSSRIDAMAGLFDKGPDIKLHALSVLSAESRTSTFDELMLVARMAVTCGDAKLVGAHAASLNRDLKSQINSFAKLGKAAGARDPLDFAERIDAAGKEAFRVPGGREKVESIFSDVYSNRLSLVEFESKVAHAVLEASEEARKEWREMQEAGTGQTESKGEK